MQVFVFNIKSSITGGGIELIECWFDDLTVITDIIGNNMSEGKISGNLNPFEYITSGK